MFKEGEIMKYIKVVVVFMFAVLLCSCKKDDSEYDLLIVTSKFPSFDFARSIVKDNNKVKLYFIIFLCYNFISR